MKPQNTPANQISFENTHNPVADLNADATLDLRGQWCPLPPLKTVAKLKGMRPGQVLEVLGTNPVGNRVAPWVAQKLGDQLLGIVEDRGFHRFYFRKSP